MGQMTIYLDDELREKVKHVAKREGQSVSSWIRTRIEDSIEDEWPPGYFDLFGELGSDVTRPDQPDLEDSSDQSW